MRKRQPDTEAQRLVQTYADLILRLGYTYLKSTHDAEDVCQNVLIKLLQTDRAFESAEHERAWIVRRDGERLQGRVAQRATPHVGGARRRRGGGRARGSRQRRTRSGDGAVAAVSGGPVPALLRGLHRARDRGHDGGPKMPVAARLSRGRKKLRALLEGADDDR